MGAGGLRTRVPDRPLLRCTGTLEPMNIMSNRSGDSGDSAPWAAGICGGCRGDIKENGRDDCPLRGESVRWVGEIGIDERGRSPIGSRGEPAP